MHPKLARINALIDSGFECVDINSDDACIEVVLAQNDTMLTFTLDRHDAQEILLHAEPRIVPLPKKKSFLVRGPVR